MAFSEGRVLDLDCGISYERISSWLDDELNLAREGQGWVFRTGSGTAIVRADSLESRSIGPVSLERTHLVARGDSDALDAFERLFTLRFISAGG